MGRRDIAGLPKVELHLHLDCCLSFEVVSRLQPQISKEAYRREFVAPAKCLDLADYLSRTHSSIRLMQTERGLRLVTADLFRQLERDRVIYAELRFAPLQHLESGLSPTQVVEIVEAAVTRGIEETGIEARLILCTLRHFSPEQSMTTAKLVEAFRGSRVAALDIAADEAGFGVAAHIGAFDYARRHGLRCTAHAGEAKGPESVRETLAHFTPSRIGHGVRSIEDPQLIVKLKAEHIHLEVCPSCNVQIDIFDTYADHPVDKLYRAGVSLGINTDTRTLTDVSLCVEYERLRDTFGWRSDNFLACNRMALAAAFLEDDKKEALGHKLTQGYGR
jgi:adenosine deaminase